MTNRRFLSGLAIAIGCASAVLSGVAFPQASSSAPASAPSSGNVLLIWAREAKICGTKHRPSYQLEVVDKRNLSKRSKAVDAETAGSGYLWKNSVPNNRCVSVASVDRKASTDAGPCSFTTHMWEIGATAEAAEAKLQSKIRTTSGVTSSFIIETACYGARETRGRLQPLRGPLGSAGVRG